MIREDREQLNDRFIKVFKILEDRGEIVKNDRNGKGMGDFAEKILGNRAYGHIIRAFLNPKDKRCIDYRHARTLCDIYGVNEAYMIDGLGTPFGFDLPQPSRTDRNEEVRKDNILLTTIEAFAGDSVLAEQVEETTYFSIPGLEGGGLVAFPINGNSMIPVINDADIVICREILGPHEIKDNKIYAVKVNGQLWVKYVKQIPNEKGRITNLKLISANHLEYDPFVIDVNEYTRLYEVIRRISYL